MTGRVAAGRYALLILPILCAPAPAQNRRLRGADIGSPAAPATAPAPVTPRAAASPVAAATAPASQTAAPVASPSTPAPEPQAPSLLQQPAEAAQIVFDSNRLAIKANNSSLAAILQEVSAKSGMKVEGLGGDERVFGSFGPGAPRDVLADLLNGTSYNLVLLGDLSDGAPRQLILSPASPAAASTPASTQAPAATAEETEPEREEPPPPPEPPPPSTPAPGVKTPQQLFEQLQKMRQSQGQGQPPQQPVQQDSPLQ